MTEQRKPPYSPTVMLCGCGWLGQPLGQRLARMSLRVFGTSTRATQLDILKEQGIEPIEFVMDKTDSQQTVFATSMLSALAQTDILVVNIPPGRRHLHAPPFIAAIKQLIQHAIRQQPNINVIFISTTSVFGELTGAVDEDTAVEPVTASGRAHADIEQWCLNQYPQQACVVRLAGLIDDLRHPVTSLVKRPALANGEHCVNLVHKDDVVNALIKILLDDFKRVAGRIFHLCAPDHPTRQEYYQAAAAHKGLGEVTFTSTAITSSNSSNTAVQAQNNVTSAITGKIVQAQKTQQWLGLQYEYPSPYDML